ncbi:MAG: AraC family transcriptional regulator [Ruminiclostridium sp.]|nr:AraC family transcriptional regulator [Ruminiclostridium sp.]
MFMNEIIIANNSLPQLCGCGLFAASESFIHTDRVPDFCVLIYVIDGCIYVTEGDTDYEVNAGELLILKNGVHHFGKKKIQKGTKWIFVHFRISADCNASPFYPDASPLGTYDATAESILTLPKFLDSVSARFEKELKTFIEYAQSDDAYKKWFINQRLFLLLSSLAVSTQGFSNNLTLSDRICRYLSDNIGVPFNSENIEKRFYLSYKYMSHLFKKEKGVTMQQYHNSVRMDEACRLLCSTLMSIGEIADKLGFSDVLYFSRCFRNYTGKSPSTYRKDSARYF